MVKPSDASVSRWWPATGQARRIALWYAGVSSFWILCSGRVLHRFVHDQATVTLLEDVKGWMFVLVTAILLCWVLDRSFKSVRRSVHQIQDSEAKLHLIGDNLPDTYVYQYTCGPASHRTFTYVSAGVERVLGITPAQVLQDASCLFAQVPPEQLVAFAAAEEESARTLADFEIELTARHVDGRVRTLLVRSQPRRNGDNQILWDGFAQDVTELKRTETALRERENQLHLFVEHSPAAIAMLDCQMRYLVTSQRWLSDYRLRDQTIIGRSHYEIFPEAPERWKEIHQRCLAGAVEKNEADRFPRSDGSVDWIRWEVRPWRTAQGAIGGLIIFSELITESKRAEEALRQSEENFRAMFELASIGMAQADPQTGQWLRVNRKMCEITGYSAEEMRRLRLQDITHPEDRQSDWEQLQRVMRGDAKEYRMEKRYVRKDGTVAWVNVNVTVIRDLSHQPVRTMATIEDITERKRTEEVMKLQSAALQAAANAIVIADRQGNIEWANPAFTTITGYGVPEIIGQNLRLLKSGKHDQSFYHDLWRTILSGKTWHNEIINRRKDGTLYSEEVTITPLRDSRGAVNRFIAIKQDVSERKRLETQFHQAQKMEAIGQLAGGVAHDFNNILGAMMLQTELTVRIQGLPEEAREGLQEIRAATERAAQLTRQLLLFSRKQVMQPRDLDLNEVVIHLAKMLQRIIGEDIGLQLHLHPTPLTTHADAAMLDQILMNLAVNARDAMPEGGRLTIETAHKTLDATTADGQPDANPGRYVWLSISDTGCGIPPEVLPRIFEPFFTTKQQGKGTGLGLATVFGIVKQHRGWIKVDSQPGHGATFQIYLPAGNNPIPAPRPAGSSQIRGGTETILLAEDDAAVRVLTRRLLERHGYTILEAANGVEALRIWEQQSGSVALLLTDLVMPAGISGQHLAKRLKSDKPTLRIVFTSGYSAEIAGRGIELQPGEVFVQKPCTPDQLLESIRGTLDSP